MKSQLRIAFLHGFESKEVSDKTKYLDDNFICYHPKMDYNNPNLFEIIYHELYEFKPDYIVGSSMGGWYAYCYSTLLNVPSILFNPAMHGRPIEVPVIQGQYKPIHHVILGEFDDVLDYKDTLMWFYIKKTDEHVNYDVQLEPMEHRTPIEIFKKYMIIYALHETY